VGAAALWAVSIATATAAAQTTPVGGPRPASPDGGAASARSRPSDADPPPPSCLDRSIVDELGQSLRPIGVQKKTFLKARRFELIAHGGLYASDLMSSSYVYGGSLSWYATEDLGLELSVDVAPVALDIDAPIADFFGDPRFPEDTGVLVVASALWSPIHYKIRTSGGSILHGDVMFALGGGRLVHDTTQGVAVSGGMVIELYAARWLSLRLDLRDVILVQEAVAETRMTNNLTAMLGVGLWFPFGF
jgi:outer membrane beta-barrel protein